MPLPATQTAKRPITQAALVLIATLSLAACATGPMRVATDVQAFRAPASANAMPANWQGVRYRFDVLPSQAGLDVTPLQAMTQAALAQHGLVRDDAQARFAVQVSASVRTAWVDDGWGPYGTPGPYGWGPGWRLGLGYGYGYPGWGAAYLPTSTYLRELRIAMLDLGTGQTVYETRARNESPSGQNDAIFAAMVSAALKDFPHAAAGWQRVVTELPAASAARTGAPSAASPSGALVPRDPAAPVATPAPAPAQAK